MAKDGNVTGDYHGARVYHDQVQFNQTITGMIGVPGTGKIWYVDANKTSGTTGDGTSWLKAFLTVTEGLAALSDYDVLIIAPAYYNETLKMTLSGVDGCKILGYGTGMQWNEGGTMIGDETSTDDILDIVDCKGLEIAGIMFYNVTSEKDAINFVTTNSYATHIHDCCFIGDVGGGTVMEDGISNANNCSDLYVHDCRFFKCENAAIASLGMRSTVQHCVFVVPNSGTGIKELDETNAFSIVTDNYFLGGGTSDVGIKGTAATAGNYMLSNNHFANFAANSDIVTHANGDVNVTTNYEDGTNGAVTAVDPSV